MKKTFLDALTCLEDLSHYTELDSDSLNILKGFRDYRGMLIRVFTGGQKNPWKTFSIGELPRQNVLSLCATMSESTIDEPEDFLRVKSSEGNCLTLLISPYMSGKSHYGDLILLLSGDLEYSIAEWHLFCDHLATKICQKFRFPERLQKISYDFPEKLINFLRDTQSLLNTARNVDALPPGNDKKQAFIWFNEDNPILELFLQKLQREYCLDAAFLIQKAAPDYIHQVLVANIDDSENPDSSIEDMLEETLMHECEIVNAIISRKLVRLGKSEFSNKDSVPLVFSCQAGGETYGHLGIFLSSQEAKKHVNHAAKLMPMLANQLGLYFSYFFQLRKEALHGRMLQQINQTCNTINSSVDIGAILFKLIESLNYLFGQYSGAILIFSRDSSELEIVNYLGGEIPHNFDLHNVIMEKGPIVEAINEGSAFDNRDGSYPLPIRYVLPLATTPQASAISHEFLPLRSLGGVVLFESPLNKQLREEDLTKLMPILLNGISASLQVACNYAEKLDTIKALEGMMERLSDTDALLDEMILIIRRLLKVNRISFLEVDEEGQYLTIKKGYGLPEGIAEKTRIPIGEEISGYVALKGRSYRIDNIESEGIFKKRSLEHYLNRSLLSVPLINPRAGSDKKVIGVINVNNKTSGLTFTAQDQQLLEAIAHLVVTALENVKYLEEQHEKQLLERQLSDARDIQMSLMPKSFADLPENLDMYGKSLPAKQIGGDFFDILRLDDGRILAVLGDVSGKGMPAAILMAVTRMIIRSAVQDLSDTVSILERVNQKLTMELDSYHFVTMQIVAVDPLTGQCEMSSAGHGPLTVCLNGVTQLIETKGGPPLGIAGVSGLYSKNSFCLQSGDSLIMYTDGLSEEHAKNGEMFGTERINTLMSQNCDKSAKEIAETFISSAINWRGASDAHDDLTLLTLKIKGSA